MTAPEQAKFMIGHHGTKEKALEAHKEIMNNIVNIYDSVEDARNRSQSYPHLEEVELEIEKL